MKKILLTITILLITLSSVFGGNTTNTTTPNTTQNQDLFTVDTDDTFTIFLMILIYTATLIFGLYFSMIPFSLMNLFYALIVYASNNSIIISLLFLSIFVFSLVFQTNIKENTGITSWSIHECIPNRVRKNDRNNNSTRIWQSNSETLEKDNADVFAKEKTFACIRYGKINSASVPKRIDYRRRNGRMVHQDILQVRM